MIRQLLRKSFLHRPFQALAHAYIIRRWQRNGRPLPPPAVFKQKLVKKFGRKFGLNILVETGTAKGNMVRACQPHFQKIISIELDPALYQQARQNFAPYKNITLLHGDSGERLVEVLKAIKEPAIFWLDAHAMAGGLRPPQITPILQELSHILNHTVKNHVILIDDARLFTEESDYPTLWELKSFVWDQEPTAYPNIEVADDIILILPT